MKQLTWLSIVLPLALIGCSEGFKTDPGYKKITGTGNTGSSTGYGSTGGTTGGTSGGTTGSSGGTSSGTSTGGTGSSCTPGNRGTPPDLAGLVSTFKSQNGTLITADCTTGSRQFITGLVNFLRGQGHTRVGYAVGYNEIDKLAYLWDTGSCEGSTNTTVMDVLGSTCVSNSPQWNTFANNAPFTLTPPSNGSPETGGTTGGTTSGGTTGNGKVPPPASERDFIKSISDANPGMINDCTGQPIANNFLITVIRALQAKDPRWGFMVKYDPNKRIPRDIIAYRSRDEMDGTHNFYVIDFVSAGCNNTPSDPNFTVPATTAGVYFNLLNGSDGYAGNGVWQFDP